MSFAAPWLLWALFAAALPVIIHLVNRWRHKSIAWAAMEFLLRAIQETRGKKRLLQYIILALRVGAVAALVIAFARPLIGNFLHWASGDIAEVVVIQDRSSSMGAAPDKVHSLRDVGLAALTDTLNKLQVNRVAVLDSTTKNITQIPEASFLTSLPETQVSDADANMPELIQQALAYLAESKSAPAEIWINSDMQAASWAPDSALWQTIRTELTHMQAPPVIRVLAQRTRPQGNRSIRVEKSYVENNRLVLHITILQHGNFTNEQESVPLQLNINNITTTINAPVTGQRNEIVHKVPLAANQTQGFGSIELPHDDHTRDNTAYFTFSPPVTANVLILGNEGESTDTLALLSAPPGLSHRHASVSEQLKLSPGLLSQQALVIINGLPQDQANADLLRQYVNDGGMVFMLPCSEEGGVALKPFLGVSWEETEQAAPEQVYQITQWQRQHGLLQDGSDHTPIPANGLQAIRKQRLIGDYVPLATWNDGTSAFAQVRSGKGMAVFAGSLPDYTWSNMADGHVLLPLLQRMILAGAGRLSHAVFYEVGDKNLPTSTGGTPMRQDQTDANNTSPADTAGVYKAGILIYAVNRAEQEDAPEQLSDEQLQTLLPDVAINSMNTQNTADSLLHEARMEFVLLAILFFLLATYLSLPAKQALPQPS